MESKTTSTTIPHRAEFINHSTYLMPKSASLSRQLQSDASVPHLFHSLHETKSSVLSLAANDKYIFSGNQNEDISVWDSATFEPKCTLRGHTGSVLDLEYAEDQQWLFSSSGDSTVRVWSTETLELLYLINPYLETGAGDLFSLTWSPSLQTIFIGCQNTLLQWFSFRDSPGTNHLSSKNPCTSMEDGTTISPEIPPTPNVSLSPTVISRKAHKFFDSYPQYERKPADIHANNGTKPTRITPGRGTPDSDGSDNNNTLITSQPKKACCSIPPENVIDSAHYGYIYCMALLAENDMGVQIVTGSGDESVKIWSCPPNSIIPELIHTFSFSHGAILALEVYKGDTIYAGCQDGYVKVLDVETKTLVRTIIVQEGIDIISMCRLGSNLYTGSANGRIKCWSASFDCTASWRAHNGIVLSSIVTKRSAGKARTDADANDVANDDAGGGFYLVTGGNDDYINIWDIEPPKTLLHLSEDDKGGAADSKSCIGTGSFNDTMHYALSKFIMIPSISCDPLHREDCRQAAIWLRKCLGQLGAHTSLLSTGEGNNLVVLGTFKGSIGEKKKRRILFYGHYDVISAPSNGWTSDPFTLSGRNGYLYGRGSTDNKGPIIAVACAAADLLSRRALEVDLVFLIEGEEEHGSLGFKDAVRQNKGLIGEVDAILVSNSTWIGDDRPCITYGLRGVVQCTLQITGPRTDLHSGIEGGAVTEPMIDMIKLLGTLTDPGNRMVQIPGFYDNVRPRTEKESDLYNLLSEVTRRPAAALSSRWAEPSLTIHNIESSGPKNATIIPGTVKAQISVRLVPDQDLESIVQLLKDFLAKSFEKLGSPNTLKIHVGHTADWWLGNLDDHWFQSLENSIQEEWGVEPLRIREGGSIPSVPYLEKEFGCHALHLPMGQSSDQAHLPDERISLINLQKGKAVVERFIVKVANEVST